MEEKCHCGLPLHYTDTGIEEYVRCMIKMYGEYVVIQLVDGENEPRYRVPRHYIALHGLKAAELDKLGFERIK